jgi:hypothetical protein
MRDEAFQQAAEELLSDAVDAGATPSEKLRLNAGPDAVVIHFGYEVEPGISELVLTPEGATAAEPSERAERPELALIYRRISLRQQLGLPKRDCLSRRSRHGCRCLSLALDRLLEQDPDKRSVDGLAKELHREFEAARKQREREQRQRLAKVEEERRGALECSRRASPAAEGVKPTPTESAAQSAEKPRVWRPKQAEEVDPLSWAAFKTERNGHIDWHHKQF